MENIFSSLLVVQANRTETGGSRSLVFSLWTKRICHSHVDSLPLSFAALLSVSNAICVSIQF